MLEARASDNQAPVVWAINEIVKSQRAKVLRCAERSKRSTEEGEKLGKSATEGSARDDVLRNIWYHHESYRRPISVYL